MPSAIFRDGLLDGRVVLVTGGGTNLGRAAAEELVACGAHVVIAGRREEVLEEAAEALGCAYVAGDIREPDGAAAIVRAALDRHGRLDVLVNNAGGQYFVPVEGISDKGWAAVQRLNVGGTLTMMQTAHALAFTQQEPRGGTIVNVTVSPHHGFPGMAHTGAARAAVEALGREHADLWRADGVAVVSAALGRFATESLQKYPAPVVADMARGVPLQRLGEMGEFAQLVALLATPLGRRFTGTTVTIDGGLDNWFGPWPPVQITEDDGTTVPTEARRG